MPNPNEREDRQRAHDFVKATVGDDTLRTIERLYRLIGEVRAEEQARRASLERVVVLAMAEGVECEDPQPGPVPGMLVGCGVCGRCKLKNAMRRVARSVIEREE